jgi:protein-disulfide isomerase
MNPTEPSSSAKPPRARMLLAMLAPSVTALLLVLPATVSAETVATVAGQTISRGDLEKHVRAQLIEVENQRYQILSQGLDEMIAERLFEKEAKSRGIGMDELRAQEIDAKIGEPEDSEVEAVYEANKAQLQGQTLEQIKPRIVDYLKSRQAAERAQKYVAELREKYPTTVNLQPPVIEVGTGGRESRGGDESAPVTIIAFSDYQCPYCRMAEKTVLQVLDTYGDKVRYFHRDYPLPFHEHAHVAAEAARCASEQNKFWEYHDKLFTSDDLSEDGLRATAGELGLDKDKFDACLSSGRYKAAVDEDMAAGAEAGVNGTPAFFVNGRMLSGAQPFESFKNVIDDEISKAAKANKTAKD